MIPDKKPENHPVSNSEWLEGGVIKVWGQAKVVEGMGAYEWLFRVAARKVKLRPWEGVLMSGYKKV